MQINRVRLPASLAVALLVAACNASAPATPSPTVAPSAAPAAGASAEPSDEATLGTNLHEAPDLENLLPATFLSATMERDSLSGADALGADSSSSIITQFLTAHGKSAPDFAVAQASDPNGQVDVEFVAFRVKDVDPAILVAAIVDATKASDPELVVSQTTVHGHQITRGDSGGVIRYLYPSNGVVFGVSSGSQTVVDQAVAALP